MSSDELRYDGKVAVITGAGGGLGRAHALLFGGRGAKVIVNDLGGSAFGEGKSASAADRVVEEIRSAGGEAAPSYDSVEDGDKIIQAAMDHFGRVDIIVNNAGILRDKSFAKMSHEDWELIYRVHVYGSFRVTHAAWPHLREQQYGRIIMTASAAGLYGNFGQANYSMAKLGLAGFGNTLALEGQSKNVLVNTIAPIAGSRLTETVMPADLVAALDPAYVSPLVAYLCHESSKETGGIFEVGGGFFGKLRWERTQGRTYRRGRTITPETVRDDWDRIASFEETTHPTDVMSSMQPIVENVQAEPSRGGNRFIDVDAALGYTFPETTSSYDERDLALYALGVGAANDPYSQELRYVYELHPDGFAPLPTFGVVPAVNAFLNLAKEGHLAPGLNFGFERVLHGEQYTEVKRPLPSKAKLTHRSKVARILDKGKNAVLDIETRSFDEDDNELLVNNIIIVARGCGGWEGDQRKSGKEEKNVPPDRKPDAIVEERISANQALLYRLSGDWNPLHADPSFAQAVGFDKPILHGLCTFGYAGRHVINAFCGGDPRFFKSIDVRMAASVFPGETLVTEMWKTSDQRIVVQCRVKERDETVIKNGAIELYAEIPKPPAKKVDAKEESASEPNSADVFEGITGYVADHADELKNKVDTVFQFQLSEPDSVWTIDLKKGTVSAGESTQPDCTLALSDADFMGMTKGELDPQKLFMSGKLKISGNIMASQKLTFLQKVEPERVLAAMRRRAGVPAAAPAESIPTQPSKPKKVKKDPKAPKIFERLTVPKGSGRLQLNLTDPASQWLIDRTEGTVAAGTGSADATLTMSEETLIALMSGASPQNLYQQGKIRVDGDIRVAKDLSFLKG